MRVLLQAILCVVTSAGVLALYGVWWKWTEKQKAADLPLHRLAGDTALGFGVGILFFILVTGCIALLGGYRIDSVNWDWKALIRSLFMFGACSCSWSSASGKRSCSAGSCSG